MTMSDVRNFPNTNESSIAVVRYFDVLHREKATGHALSDSSFPSQTDCRYLQILRVVVDALQQER